MKKTLIAVAGAGLLASACTATGETERQAAVGAGLGAVAGAIIGNNVGGGSAATGAAIGAAVGGTAGAVRGSNQDRQTQGVVNRRQYYDQRVGRYYFYDPATGRQYWENGEPRY